MTFSMADEAAAGYNQQSFLAPPTESDPETSMVQRSFLFLDVVGSVKILETEGPNEIKKTLLAFRQLTKEVAAKRGIRVAKWLGDGAMIVSTSPERLYCAAGEFMWRANRRNIPVSGGMATGDAIIFEGDDYISASANLAARLMGDAKTGEVLTEKSDLWKSGDANWVRAHSSESKCFKGFDYLINIISVTGVTEEVYQQVDPEKIPTTYLDIGLSKI